MIARIRDLIFPQKNKKQNCFFECPNGITLSYLPKKTHTEEKVKCVALASHVSRILKIYIFKDAISQIKLIK